MSRVLAVFAGLAAITLAPLVMALAFAAAMPVPAAPRLPAVGQSDPQQGEVAGVVLAWANSQVGDRYVMGANGPDAWDCSSFTQAAYGQVNIRLPRTAQQQRDWLATGHGIPVAIGQERPGDLIFWDSYLGPRTIGHVVLVEDPTRHRTVEAHNTRAGVGHFTYQANHHRYEIWRPHTRTDRGGTP